MPWNPFTKKIKKNNKKITNNNAKLMAKASANAMTIQKFGRKEQSRVYNIFKEPGKVIKTNEAAVYRQDEEAKFYEKYKKHIKLAEAIAEPVQLLGAPAEAKATLKDVIDQLGTKITAAKQEEGSQHGGSEFILFEIPILVAEFIWFILKIVYYFFEFLYYFGKDTLNSKAPRQNPPPQNPPQNNRASRIQQMRNTKYYVPNYNQQSNNNSQSINNPQKKEGSSLDPVHINIASTVGSKAVNTAAKYGPDFFSLF